MKKTRMLVVLLAILCALTVNAFAASLSISYNQETGWLSWTVSNFGSDEAVNLKFGSHNDILTPSHPTGGTKVTTPGTYTVSIPGDSETFTVAAATATPEPTEAPTEAPTEEPVVSEKPTAKPTKKPTSSDNDSSSDADEVPKTGDAATTTYVVMSAMVLAAAYLVVRRVLRRN